MSQLVSACYLFPEQTILVRVCQDNQWNSGHHGRLSVPPFLCKISLSKIFNENT